MHASPVLRRCAIAATSVAVAAALAGCGPASESHSTGGLAIVVGARSNTPPPTLAGITAQARDAAILDQSKLAIVVADGQPFTWGNPGELATNGANPVARQQERDRNRRLVDQALLNARARTPETDLLAALDLAARSIHSSSSPHTIVTLDSGLSTAGALDFRKSGLLDADPDELADSLKAAHELPDLTGDDVVFQGLGDVADPQQPLDTARRSQLIAIWTAVVRAAGAHSVENEQTPLEGNPPTGLPVVSVVPLGNGLTCTASTVTLTGGDVAFQPGKAVFLDPSAASSLLQPIAKEISNDGLAVQLTGDTARWGSPGYQKQLSQQRAQAIADVLASLGVPTSRMTVVGLGSDFPGYLPDNDVSGALIPDAAAANRKVVLDLSGATTVNCPQP